MSTMNAKIPMPAMGKSLCGDELLGAMPRPGVRTQDVIELDVRAPIREILISAGLDRALDGVRDAEERKIALQESGHGHFVRGVEDGRRRTARAACGVRELHRPEGRDIDLLEREVR